MWQSEENIHWLRGLIHKTFFHPQFPLTPKLITPTALSFKSQILSPPSKQIILENINILIDYCINHNILLENICRLQANPSANILNDLAFNYPVIRFNATLNHFQVLIHHFIRELSRKGLIITKADKGDEICFIPFPLYQEMLLIHLKDVSTYLELSEDDFNALEKESMSIRKLGLHKLNLKSHHAVKQHQTTFKRRYMHLLMKIHKNPNDWQIPFLIPKTRPIISDCNTTFADISKAFLPVLQGIESKFHTVCTNSISVVHNLSVLSQDPISRAQMSSQGITMFTADVDALFTSIPLEDLTKILENFNLTHLELQFLHGIIHHNGFQVEEVQKKYKQIRGLPMGNALSGSLANIYLAEKEKTILSKYRTEIAFYSRYMDDIFIIFYGAIPPDFTYFFQKTISLKLSNCLSNSLLLPFLDVSIFFTGQDFISTVHAKNPSILSRIPFHLYSVDPKESLGVAKTELIRIWRINNTSNLLRQQLHSIYLQNKKIPQLFFKGLLAFFRHSGKILAHHLLCESCRLKDLKPSKTMEHKRKTYAATMPINCETVCFYLVKETEEITYMAINNLHGLHQTHQDQGKWEILPYRPVTWGNKPKCAATLTKFPEFKPNGRDLKSKGLESLLSYKLRENLPPLLHQVINKKFTSKIFYKSRRKRMQPVFQNIRRKLKTNAIRLLKR